MSIHGGTVRRGAVSYKSLHTTRPDLGTPGVNRNTTTSAVLTRRTAIIQAIGDANPTVVLEIRSPTGVPWRPGAVSYKSLHTTPPRSRHASVNRHLTTSTVLTRRTAIIQAIGDANPTRGARDAGYRGAVGRCQSCISLHTYDTAHMSACKASNDTQQREREATATERNWPVPHTPLAGQTTTSFEWIGPRISYSSCVHATVHI